MPHDAEAWLAERGIEREPIRVAPAPPAHEPDATASGPVPADRDGPPVSAREATRLAQQAAADTALVDAERASHPDPAEPRLEDEVAAAVAYVRRSTSGAPQSVGRLREKLADRGHPAVVIDLALERAQREGVVDDHAMAAALVDERRRKGHAPARIRRDLAGRGFTDDVLDPLLASAEAEDLEAAAFDLAQRRADGLSGVPAESAYRRVAAYVARRGYPDGLARKVAREAVFAARESERAAGH